MPEGGLQHAIEPFAIAAALAICWRASSCKHHGLVSPRPMLPPLSQPLSTCIIRMELSQPSQQSEEATNMHVRLAPQRSALKPSPSAPGPQQKSKPRASGVNLAPVAAYVGSCLAGAAAASCGSSIATVALQGEVARCA